MYLSIIIPVYNAATTIERTLDSLQCIADAHIPRVEVILVNDGSVDDSGKIIQRYIEKHSHWQWVYVEQSNFGAAAARNTALRRAVGEWVMFLDADDALAIDPVAHIATMAGYSCGLFALEYRSARRKRTVRPVRIDPHNFMAHFSAFSPFGAPSVIFRRDGIDCLFTEGIMHEDWLFWVSNPRIFAAQCFCPEIVSAQVYLHGGNISADYVRAGISRQYVGEHLLGWYQNTLPLIQTNNLRIQVAIGKIQQGKWPSISAFRNVPCNGILFIKLCIYAAAKLLGQKATRY